VSEKGLTSHSTRYRSFRRRSSRTRTCTDTDNKN